MGDKMSSNINLWFAKDENGNIVTVNDVNKEYEGKYYCPLCGSEVIPKALDSNMVSPHFAHINREACSGESIFHYWVKNQLIKVDDIFEVVTNEPHQYMCEEILIEQSYETPYGLYRPDATIITYKGEKIFVEINYANKKNVNDYYLKWKHLGNIVIEFNIKNVYDEENNKINITNSFKALYFEGMSINKNDGGYISYKRSISDKHSRFSDKINEIEWFIDDLYKYNVGINSDLDELTNSLLFLAKDQSNLPVLEILYKNNRCQDVIKKIIEKRDCFTRELKNIVGIEDVTFEINGDNRRIIDRIKNNSLNKRVKLQIENEVTFKILSKFIDEYKYFLNSLLKDENNIETVNCYSSSVWGGENRIVLKLKSVVDDICSYDKYIKEMIEPFKINDIESHVNKIIKLKDYVVTSDEDFKEMFLNLFTSSRDNVLSILVVNNKDNFNEVIRFIEENKGTIKYNNYIQRAINSIDFEDFVYINDDLKLLDISKASMLIMSTFKKEYDIFNREFEKYISKGMVHVGGCVISCYNYHFKYHLEKNNFSNKLLKVLNEEGFFKNYNNYNERNKEEIKNIIFDIIIKKIEKEKEKYMKVIEGEMLLNLNIFSYFELINNDDILIRMSERYEMIYKLQTIFVNISNVADMKISGIEVFYDVSNDEFEIIIETEFENCNDIYKYTIKINNDSIMLNNIPMVKIYKMNSIDEFINKLKFIVDVITKNNKSYLDDEIITIYQKLISIYRKRTFNSYKISVDYSLSGLPVITISYLDIKIATCMVNENTKFEDVINVFSNAIRKYLYGGEN